MDTQNPHSTVESDDLIKELEEPLIMTNLNGTQPVCRKTNKNIWFGKFEEFKR